MASISSSTALTKRSMDTSFMPPPPPPKRIKRPAKVLDEDDYMDALSHIIARDFFPGLLETESKQDYLNALDSQDHEWIASAGRKLTEVMTPGPDGRRLRGRRGTSMTPSSGSYGRGGETPRAWQGDTPMSVVSDSTTTSTQLEKPEIDTNMSLGAFQEKYTSEDNESFYKLLDKQNLKRVEKHAWMWNGNKIPAPRQIAHKKREALLAANKASQVAEDGKELAIINPKDMRPAMPETWKARPDNNFMFNPSSVEDSIQTVAQKAQEISLAPPKTVLYDNTRITSSNFASSSDHDSLIPPSPSLSAVRDAISGNPRPSPSSASFSGASTPRVNGYAYVDSEPEPSPSPLLLGNGDSTPNPFKLSESSKREALHHRMVDKVAKGKRIKGRESDLRTPVPRFASSPRIARGGMTPAAQSLLGRVNTGKTPAGLREGTGLGKTPRMSGLRHGWTPRTDEKT
ncbi:protein DGCR14, partial [Lecanoromycetidae sp. Uapishka_2]